MQLDMLVIGSGPGGQRAAVQAAKLGKRVAVCERRDRLGGLPIHTRTIPPQTPRQTGGRALRGLRDRAAGVAGAETAVGREQFRRNNVGLVAGDAFFEDAYTV